MEEKKKYRFKLPTDARFLLGGNYADVDYDMWCISTSINQAVNYFRLRLAKSWQCKLSDVYVIADYIIREEIKDGEED